MTKLINYLYDDVLKLIIKYLINIKININPISDFIEDNVTLKCIKNEIIKYSLVSKQWNHMVSNHLVEMLDFRNYDFLKIFVGDSDFKLIGRKSPIKIYNSVEEYNNKIGEVEKYKFKKILILSYYQGLLYLNELNQVFPSSVSFGANFRINELPTHIQINEDDILYPKQMERIILSEFEGANEYQVNKAIKYINQLEPKKILIQYQPNLNLDSAINTNITNSLSSYFKLNSLRSFIVESPFLEPFNFFELNTNITKIKVFDLRMIFIKMIKLLNGEVNENVNCFIKPNSIQSDWNQMIKILCECKSIKVFGINGALNYLNLDYYQGCIGRDSTLNEEEEEEEDSKIIEQIDKVEGYKASYLTEGLKVLLSNPTCSIKTLQLVSVNYLFDSLFLEGLALNKSISTLVLYNDINYIKLFSHILPTNRSIRNIQFMKSSLENFTNFIYLINKISTTSSTPIEFYSLTLCFYEIQDQSQLDHIIDIINSSSVYIKEYSLYVDYSFNVNSQIILNNNIILNLKKL